MRARSPSLDTCRRVQPPRQRRSCVHRLHPEREIHLGAPGILRHHRCIGAGGFLLTHQSLEYVLHCRQLVPVGRRGDLNYRAYYEMGSGLTVLE
jgi:hypothetical protein